jgi:hypothetical protein
MSWSLALMAAVALLATACSSSSSGSTATASAGAPTNAPTSAPTTAASEAASTAAESSAPSEAPSIEIPSFALPNDDKGLEALLPGKLCGKTATKLSMSGERFAGVTDKTFTDTLTKIGKSPKDVAFAVAAGAPGSGCKEVAVVFQIKGADPGRFRDVFIEAAKAQSNTTYTTGNIGGKDVYIGTTPGNDTKAYAYFKGDGLFIVDAPDDAAAAPLLQEMP